MQRQVFQAARIFAGPSQEWWSGTKSPGFSDWRPFMSSYARLCRCLECSRRAVARPSQQVPCPGVPATADGDFAALCAVSQGIPGTGPWRCGAAADLAKPNAFHAQAANFGLPSEVKPGAWRPNHQSDRWQVGTAPGVDPAARTKVSFATPPGPAMWAG